jgi:hypothetical protein
LWAFCGLSFVLVDKNFTTEAHLCQPIFGEGIAIEEFIEIL